MNCYLKKAEENLLPLHEYTVMPEYEKRTLQTGDSITLDLGNYYVGYFSFVMDWVDVYIDAPVKLAVKFCEGEKEIDADFSTQTSFLSSWLQEEIIHVDFPGRYNMPRRYACRHVKITVLFSPQKLTLSRFTFRATTSADLSRLTFPALSDPRLAEIDKVSVNTLKNCMQRVFEDGPRRDRRLWIGDLRLEALANYYTFNNLELVKRCLYLFAASEKNERGFVCSFVYENPVFVSGSDTYLVDYALLYAATACDYVLHTGDKETFLDISPVVKAQLEGAHSILDEGGIISRQPGWFVFIDWCPGIECIIPLHGVYLYTLDLMVQAVEKLLPEDAAMFRKWLDEGRTNAKKVLYDAKNKRFSNSRDKNQYSVHSAAWMILGGVLEAAEAREVLTAALNSPESKKPVTPYMYHYVIEAMIKIGMEQEAKSLLTEFWGEMLDWGAVTFHEMHIPGQPDFSAYGSYLTNSLCHAWSCTPSYFIRKYWTK